MDTKTCGSHMLPTRRDYLRHRCDNRESINELTGDDSSTANIIRGDLAAIHSNAWILRVLDTGIRVDLPKMLETAQFNSAANSESATLEGCLERRFAAFKWAIRVAQVCLRASNPRKFAVCNRFDDVVLSGARRGPTFDRRSHLPTVKGVKARFHRSPHLGAGRPSHDRKFDSRVHGAPHSGPRQEKSSCRIRRAFARCRSPSAHPMTAQLINEKTMDTQSIGRPEQYINRRLPRNFRNEVRPAFRERTMAKRYPMPARAKNTEFVVALYLERGLEHIRSRRGQFDINFKPAVLDRALHINLHFMERD